MTLIRSHTCLQIVTYMASGNEADAPSLGPGSFEQLRELSDLGAKFSDMAAPRQQDDAPSSSESAASIMRAARKMLRRPTAAQHVALPAGQLRVGQARKTPPFNVFSLHLVRTPPLRRCTRAFLTD